MNSTDRIAELCRAYLAGDHSALERIRLEQQAEQTYWQNVEDDACGDPSLARLAGAA